MPVSSFILLALLAAVEPLTPDEQQRLAAATDGTDHLDDAFEALLANVRRWTPGLGDAPVRLHPDLEAMGSDPVAFRGDLCRLEGRLEQLRLLETHSGVQEWFVRDGQGRPALVFVVGAQASLEAGQRITVLGRFYKRLEAVARDGRRRGYPAFVGAAAPPQAPGAAAWGAMIPVLVPVLVMFVVFLGLLVYARRGRAARRPPVEGVLGGEGEQLPGDTADALAELRRRADASP